MEKLGFGLMRLPLKDAGDSRSIDMDMFCAMVDRFIAQGFTYFDTAYMYHDYMSEIAMREALVRRYPRDAFTIADKLPTMFLKAEGDQERIFDEQLEKCGVDYFDYYLLHNLGVGHCKMVDRFDSFSFIARKKAEGLIKKTGFSFHDSPQLLDELLTAHPEIDFVQLQLNYLDWNDPEIRSRQCLEVAVKHRKPVVVMEPVKGGTLASVPAEAQALFKRARPDMSVSSWAVRFAASQPGVMLVLSGMSDMAQMTDNLSYMKNFCPMSQEELETLKEASAVIKNAIAIACTSCRYCVEGCPKHIPIPRYFSLYNAEKRSPSIGFSTQGVYYSNLAEKYGKASDCVACHRCEQSCPQHLPVTQYLKQVAQLFETDE